MKASNTGKRYWRSLSELENSPEFDEFLQREFPVAAAEFPDGISRRRWLQLMAASLAFGGLAGCRDREEKIAPLAKRPEDWVPGRPQRYATSIELAGAPRSQVTLTARLAPAFVAASIAASTAEPVGLVWVSMNTS